MILRLAICLWIPFLATNDALGAFVRDVSPDHGSLGGETRLTIFGGGFSADQFSQNDDPNTGNFVYLVSESGSRVSCPVHKDGSTEDQVMCYTPEKMAEEDYYVKVVVDGSAVPDDDLCWGNPTSSSCRYKPETSYTPTVNSLKPQSGVAGEFVTMTGSLFSDRYGSNLPSATNGRAEKLLRIYVGPQDCGLKDGDDFYGLWVDEESDEGSLRCKTKGTSVGFFNASFIIESPFGRSLPDSQVYRVSYNDQIYMYQTYTEITSISPSSGSTEGGLTLTIYGNYFDDRAPYKAPKVYVGGTVCEVTRVVVDEFLECTVAGNQGSSSSKNPGNRGINFEYWTSTTKSMSDIVDVLSLTSSDAGYASEFLDETYYEDVNDTMDNYVSRMTTFFSPPHDGVYQFQMLADDGAKLFINGTEQAASSMAWAYTDRMTLQSNVKYLLEVIHYEGTGESNVHLKAKFFDTQFTNSWTGKAEQEEQTISISSTVVYDVQELTFSGFEEDTAVNEVQTIEVETPGSFRIGLFGVYTGPLTTTASESMVADAVNALPVWGAEESVTVVRAQSSVATFEFTFNSRRGDFPMLDVVKVANDSDVTVTVTQTIRGVSDMDTMSLTLEGTPSPPLTLSTLTSGELEDALDVMFGASCPDMFESETTKKSFESFEAAGQTFSGTRVKDTEPFCGRYSLKNPWKIFRITEDQSGILLSQYKELCFAYKGVFMDYIWLTYSYKDASTEVTETRTDRYSYAFDKDSDTESETWYYTCINVFDLVESSRPSDSQYRLEDVRIYRHNSDYDVYVDAVYIGQGATTDDFTEINRRRLRPGMPNDAQINTLTVSSPSADVYTVTLNPFDCGNQFPLFELTHGTKKSGVTASPSSAASYKMNGGSGTMSVSRTTFASPPVQGTIELTFNGVTKSGLDVSLDDVEFGKELESLRGIGDLTATKTGDCANFNLRVRYDSLPGDLSEMTVSDGDLTGIDASAAISTNVDGGLYYDPLTGDMLSTVESTPQVRVYINDVPTKCSGDCSFQWDSSATPSVTGVTPTSGTLALGTSISITGTGFSSTNDNNMVTIGGVDCTVTAATTSSITCDVGNGPVGEHKVKVNVAGKGLASHPSGDVMFSYTADISGISPTTGSLGGGGTLTISGYGFKDGATVTVGSSECEVLSVDPDVILCVIPSSASSETADITVSQGSTDLTYTGYDYDANLTATVTSISPSTLGVTGGTITIDGSSFGSSGSVYIGSQPAEVTSFTDTQIVVEIDSVDAGEQMVKVETAEGLATDESRDIPTINIELVVTNVYPLKGSLQGGTKLTITGLGFGTNDSLVEVDVGDFMCDIQDLSNSQIICQIEEAVTVHSVTNLGTHKVYGAYYAFDEPQIEIERGDIVHWTWETPDFVNDITHAIIEVDSASSTVAKEGGFTSGSPTRNGEYQYQFTQLGTFYIWSGYVDEWRIKNYAGQIEVIEKDSSLGEISVRVAGIEALQDVGGSSNPVDSSSCQSVMSAKSGCSDARPSGGDPDKFNFAFWSCSTPVVDSIDQRSGTVQTQITLTGEGFSSTDCQNEVYIGDYTCEAVSSAEDSVVCTVGRGGEVDLGVLHPVTMVIGNRGYALINIMAPVNRSFGLVPNIEDIQPTAGSMAGGAIVTISGFGFGDSATVYIGGYTCAVLSMSYTEITCETPSSSTQAEKDVEVHVNVNGSPQPAECETYTKSCRYSYALLWTPTISSIDPDATSGNTTFTITGSNLGSDTSALEVSIGGVSATITSSDGTILVATIQNIPAGSNDVIVRHTSNGKADGSLSVSRTPVISSIVPNTGSTHGETEIVISGNGFVLNDTTVTIGGSACTILSTSLFQVVCSTPAGSAGSVDVDVTSNSVSYTTDSFTYDTGSTPTVTSISPTSALPNDTVTISGSNLDGSVVTVLLGDVPCSITTGSSSQIQCTVGPHATGLVPVYVHVEEFGASNVDVEFEYTLQLSGISPSTGGTAGGQTVTLTGQGFSDDVEASICGNTCVLKETTSSEYVCSTPANSAQTCDVVVTVNGLSKTSSNAYTYDAGLTPTISGVSPTRGGTGGGTTLTVSGSGFGSTPGDISVTIGGADCAVTSASNTELECVTGPHMGSAVTVVEVEVAGNGIAEESSAGDSAFSYIDVWSSNYTWGGAAPPAAGEFVVIPAGMTLLLDTDTPVLSFLLIQGGQLIFDEKDIELQANIIMITDGGLLQVGTEDVPFEHKAIITLHGHHRSQELPIYGTKVLAVRNGSLELHGKEVPLTWTRLSATASAGDTTITLLDPVEWNVDDEIVIATTGDHHTQNENEKKTISAISGDKMTLTLDSALEADHLGTQEIFDGTTVEFRAEVGLLTHNVVVRGNTEPSWEESIEACPDGFNTGEFATQTCFQGRFGDEIGSSQFGAMILVHAPEKDTHAAEARLSYIEVTFAGQAFRLGRYPVHFHLNGDMRTSYIRGLGIHQTFNRAVNIHGTHNTMVEKTVIYNIMGGAMFLEDGIETGNTFQYNLAVFVIASSSLLNDDISPASFWVTNPNNTIQHNAAAGGTHFGFWYRMHEHPEGPSYTPDVCPVNVPLGVFYNNTAHSFGWFGLWIFPDYFPLEGGCGGANVVPAVFQGLTAWNNDKGAEAVNSGALQFVDFVLVQNKLAGYEGKMVLETPQYTSESALIKDSLIVGTTTMAPSSTQGCTVGGIVMPYGAGFQVQNVRFVNFADSECAAFTFTRISGTCSVYCGGYNYHVEGVSFINAPNKAVYAWDWEGILIDKDGSLTGKSDNEWKVVPTTGSLPSTCEDAPEFSKGVPASICPPQYKFHRFSFNNVSPVSLEGKNLLIINQFGTSSVPFKDKRLSHKMGWTCALLDGETYKFVFENGEQITNISYTGAFYEFEANDYIIVRLNVTQFPDRFSIDGGQTFVNATPSLDPANATFGDWEWDNINKEIKFIVHGTRRSKRGMSIYDVDRPLQYTSYKCYYTDCIPPPDPDTLPPKNQRPADFDYWHDIALWNMSADGYISNSLGSYGVPQDLDNVRIEFETWVVVNSSIDRLGVLLLEGVLEFNDYYMAEYEINADFIIIMGGRLIIGWPDDPFDGLVNIVLRGNASSPYYVAGGDGPTIGAKAIGVFGGLDLHGKDVGVTWTTLGSQASEGESQIVLSENVTWIEGDEIVIGASRYNPWETETFMITAVSADGMTLTLNESLKYDHLVYRETFADGQSLDLAAPVGLLTRNIKIIGEDHPKLYKESYGARVLVGLQSSKEQSYTGYARISNVEFVQTGQDGFTESYDARFSVAYIATGTVSSVKPSIVTKCAFHKGFNSAIGAFGTKSLYISNNVVHGTVGNGIVTSSDDTRVINNMVALVIWPGSYQDRYEPYNFRYEAGIEAIAAENLTLQDNIVVGSERTAYHVKPLPCDDDTGRYSNNHAYSSLMGSLILPPDTVTGDCVKMSGFIAWKNIEFGMYYQNDPSIIIDNNILVENGVGTWTGVLKPSALDHMIGDKTADVWNSLFVGATSVFDCSKDVLPVNEDNYKLSEFARTGRAPSGGMIGLTFTNFYQATNNAPEKPLIGCMAYNSIAGLTRVKNVTFAHFGGSACLGDYAVSSNKGNDDGQHPIEAEGIQFYDVDEDYKIIYHRPNTKKINSADCVDMDCDAMKKLLLKDLDGSFLGHVGSVIPESEFEWDQNPVRGLGDYRIPKEMVTDLDGNVIPYENIAPNKGIIRNGNCTYRSAWQAYECGDDLNYEMLIIESMDDDTETRRLSPLALLGDGYVDLINGPQDHGWCSGYTCRLRLSTFMALVATDKDYLLHFTSVLPIHLRYMLLNTEPEDGIKLNVWYSKPNRMDVFVDGVYVDPTNARTTDNKDYLLHFTSVLPIHLRYMLLNTEPEDGIKLNVWYSKPNRMDVFVDGVYVDPTNARTTDSGNYILDTPVGDEYAPKLSNATGTNFFDKDSGQLSIIIKGPQIIEVIVQETAIVSFSMPALSVDDFYGDNIVQNLASFLNIPLTKIRVVNVVSEGSRRRKRSTGIVVEVEIGDEPSSSINVTVSSPIDYTALLELAADIVNECQVGNITASLNISGACNSVTVPSSDPSDEAIVYNTPSPDHLVMTREPVAEYEGVPLRRQPKIQAVDLSDTIVTELGTTEYPWQLTASLRADTGHPSAVLNGTLTVNASNGWFNFTDLEISHMGVGYIIDFNVTFPDAAVNFSISSTAFDVDGRPLKANIVTMTAGDIVKNARFSIALDLRDENTDDIITDIAWRNHTWSAEATVLGNPTYGSLSGVLAADFDTSSGQAFFPDLNMTGFGIFYIKFRVVSDPADFDITLKHKINILHPNHVGMVVEEEYEIQVKFDVDYSKVLSSEDKENEFEQMILSEYANLWPDVRIKSGRIEEGSIVVTFVIDGSTTDVNATAYAVCDSISNSTSYSFDGYDLSLSSYMTVNNQTYYGVTCGEIAEDKTTEKTGLKTFVIVIIVLVCFIVFVVVIGLVIWKVNSKVKKEAKTPILVQPSKPEKWNGIPEGTFYLGNSEKKDREAISRENTFSSMRFGTSEAGTPRAPADTTHYQGLLAGNQNSSLSPPPYTQNPGSPQITKVGSAGSKIIRARTASAGKGKNSPSPNGDRSGTPVSRSHSPFPMPEGESPMTPVGETLYKGDYIYQASPRGAGPAQPALVGDAHKPDNLYTDGLV